MRKKIFILLILFFIFNSSFLILNCLCQWEPDVRLTNNPASSYTYSRNNAWSVATYDNNVHAVWRDSRDGHGEIYYKLSTDSGINWGADIRLTNSTSSRNFACIAVSGSFVHVAWQDGRHGNIEIYYKRSTNGGVTWDEDVRMTDEPQVQQNSSIAVSGSTVHVVWEDWRFGVTNQEVYYKRSSDGGISWEPEARLTNAPEGSLWPSVSASGSVVHTVWADLRDGGSGEIYYKCSTNGGITWGADIRLRNNPEAVNVASVAVSGSFVHVVWSDYRDGNGEIYYKRSTNGGINWGADTRLTSDPGSSEDPNISVSGSSVHIVWKDERDGNKEIYYKRSTDGGINWEADVRLTNATGQSEFPSVSISGSVLHVLWEDERDGNYEIYYKRNPTGNLTEIKNISSEVPEKFELGQNYPNPFNAVTSIKFKVTGASPYPLSRLHRDKLRGTTVTLKVFDLVGREVATLVNEKLQPGKYEVTFDATNLTSGIYFYRMQAGEFTDTKKLVLIK